ncbi:MAG: protein kinase [Phycisphaerae bacterium]|nr:protein kinase [Phycisphaerae bacterium]
MDTYQYQYKYGDRPLEGYTIQRAAGRGGFGEVYYTISDSGRQVALKVVQSYEQIEVRGISQCMNLKSPHLVTIFDVKYNDKGKPFVIMEFVSGPSLADLLKESPGGLGTQKAAFFLREIGKGLSFLHECGIVHRDLKPGNIFYENGYVKIGDYGLTKAISASHHVSHTITVGTVHYMAPEVGQGRYDRSIDIYALGILLYEMLTGQVPFLGSSPAEILMKHMTAAPDLTNIEEPFARVIRKALAKDPAERYQSVQAMVEDIFGAENIRNSVSQFAPEELSVVAEHIAQKMQGAQARASGQTPAPGAAETDFSKEIGKKAEKFAKKAEEFAKKAEVFRGQWAEKLKTAKERTKRCGQSQIADPISCRQRRKLAKIAILATALGAGFLCAHDPKSALMTAAVVAIMIVIASRIILRARQQWWPGLDQDSRGWGKVGTCFLAAFISTLVGTAVGTALHVTSVIATQGGHNWPALPSFVPFPLQGFWFGMVLALALPMLLVDWWKLTDPQRPRRVVVGHAIGIGMLGLIAGGIFGLQPVIAACTLAGIILVVQTLSPWGQVIANMQGVRGQGSGGSPLTPDTRHATPGTPDGVTTSGLEDAPRRASWGSAAVTREVPVFVHALWFIGWLVSLGLGLMLVIYAGTALGGHSEFGLAVACGIDSFLLSALCFIMMFRNSFAGWYRYLVRPVLLTACVQSVVTASIWLGTANPHNEQVAFGIFFIIFPAILFLVILFTPARLFGAGDGARAKSRRPVSVQDTPSGPVSPCKRGTALVLAIVGPFLGLCGLQRFYVGKIGTGILWLFTGGLLGIGQLIDIIVIATGQFKDRNELPLVMWGNRRDLGTTVPASGVQPMAAAPQSPTPAPKVEEAQAVAETRPPPAAYQPPSWPSYGSTGSVYEPWDPISGLFAAVGHIFALVAILIGLMIGLHLPRVAAAAWPSVEPVRVLGQALGEDWPRVVEQTGIMLIAALLFLAAILIMIGRRRFGPMHLIRALLGLGGFFFAIQLFREGAISTDSVQKMVELIQQNQVSPALDILFRAFSQPPAIKAGVVTLGSVLILSWPPRRRMPVFAPVPNQGVVL